MPSTPAGYAHREPTQPPPWHGLVVWDVFFNALTTGLFLVAALGELASPAVFAPAARWAYPLALVLLLVDLALLVLDLGDPLRFHHMLRVFKPSSPMSLGTWCLTAYSVPLALVVLIDWLLPASTPLGWVRTGLLVVGLPFAFGSMAYKGVLFSTSSQPGWRDARWLGAYHTSSALAMGGAVQLALATMTGPDKAAWVLARAVAALLVIQVVPLMLLLRELRPALTARHSRRRHLLTVGIALIGYLVPFLLLLTADGPLVVTVAVGFVLVVGWVVREVVVTLPQHGGHAGSPGRI